MSAKLQLVPATVRINVRTEPVPVFMRFGQHWKIVEWSTMETLKAA